MEKMDFLYKKEEKNVITEPDEKQQTKSRKEKVKTKGKGIELNI